MDDDDYFKTYLPHFKMLTNILKPPDIMIYLKANMDTLLYRIRKRSRDMEKDIDAGYLEMLLDQYEEWIKEYPHKKLIVETDELDLTCDLHPEWFLFFKAIHSKIMNNDIVSETINLSKIKEELPETLYGKFQSSAYSSIFS